MYIWIDLFSGCGGMATGMCEALECAGIRHKGYAINHSPFAVATMRANHADVTTLEMDLDVAVPSEVVPEWRIDHLHASPSCTHHSRARGGRPRSNQLRSQPDIITRWIDEHFIPSISVENVPEFMDWGPLDRNGMPIERLKGECFRAWVGGLEARNYIVEWRIVNCADYGDATSRRRFFLKAVRRGCGKIRWPEPTHAKHPQTDLWGRTPKRWRGIRECLDLTDTGTSIFNRKNPLAQNTMRRIAAGAKRYWGIDLKPFIVRLRNNQDCASIDEPISSITCSRAHHALCTPIVLDHFNGGDVQDGTKPIGAQTTHDRFSVVQPLVLGQQGGAACRPISEPCPTIACGGAIRGIFPQLADGRIIDIRMRMLRPDELAAAHSFPKDYIITGNRSQKVKQIGNSVPVRTAKAMCAADLPRKDVKC
jgi:DNA (cytosine-5)-methyltransferase 1